MVETKEIKSIPVMPFALMIGAIGGVLGFIWSLIVVIFGASLLALVPAQEAGAVIAGGILGAIILIIFATIGAFIAGFITYAIIALIYNFLAPKLGGIRLELE